MGDDILYCEVGVLMTGLIFGRPFVKRFELCYRTVVLSVCLFVLSATLVYCGQTVRWINMKLGTEVGLDPGHIVLDGDPAPPKEHSPNFQPMSIVANSWMDQDATWYVGRPRPRRHCARWGRCSPSSKKGGTAPNFLSISIVAKRLDGSR